MTPTDGTAIPDPKPARVPRKRYRRKAASAKQWAVIASEKTGPCRVCGAAAYNGGAFPTVQLHHVVSRAHAGDDTADNIVPLCLPCHDRVTQHHPLESWALLLSLTDAEYAYMVGRGGEDYAERCYGLRYVRP